MQPYGLGIEIEIKTQPQKTKSTVSFLPAPELGKRAEDLEAQSIQLFIPQKHQ